MPFRKIEAEKVAHAVGRQIETLILEGVLRPGERLPAERELAERLAVSRPSLREALADLEVRGLIGTRQGGGSHVAELTGEAFSPALIELFAGHDRALWDYLAFRRDVEGLAAARAARHGTEADHAVIAAVFARMEAAHGDKNPAREAAIDAEFHMAIIEASHNVVLLHVMRSIYALLERGIFYNRAVIYGLRETRETLLTQHRSIRDGVLSGDPAAARAAVEAHLDFVAEALTTAERLRGREEIAELRLSREERTKRR